MRNMTIETPARAAGGNSRSAFEALLDDYDYRRPRQGELLEGEVLQVGERQILVDVGLKRDAIVPDADLERLGQDTRESLVPGITVTVYVMQPWSSGGNLIVSINKALGEKDWVRAQELLDSGEPVELDITGFNKGGILARFGRLQAFILQSHVAEISRSIPQEGLKEAKEGLVGGSMLVKVIEVDRPNTRLIMSQRAARRAARQRRLAELEVGQVITGRVVGIVDYGVFVDIGGIDGLIHISNLDRRHVQHPGDVLSVGEEVTVRIDSVDVERGRIGLNRKALQPDPWDTIDDHFQVSDLVTGTVVNVVDYGVFVSLPNNFRGLIHVNAMASYRVTNPHDFVREGDEILSRIVEIDRERRRINISLDAVSAEEQVEWMYERAEAAQAAVDGESEGAVDTQTSAPDDGKPGVGEGDIHHV